MSELTDKAVAKITEEMMAMGTKNAVKIEEYLTERCKSDEVATKLLAENKSLKDCVKFCKNKARPQAENNAAMVTHEEVFEWVDEYYGITGIEAESTEVIDIMSLL